LRRMEAPPAREVGVGSAQRYPGALVATDAEVLLLMAASAARRILPRGNRMHADEVVRVHVARSHAPVTAVRTVLLRVAVGAHLRVGAGDALVAEQPVRSMPCVV